MGMVMVTNIGVWLFVLTLLIYDCACSCSNKCSVDDGSSGIECFQNTLNYFSNRMVDSIQNYAYTVYNIDQWRYRHDENSFNGSQVTQDNATVFQNKYSHLLRGNYYETNMLRDIYMTVVPHLLNNTNKVVIPPEVQCPVPCDYESKQWMYIAIVSIIFNVIMLFAIIPFMVRAERRDKHRFSGLFRNQQSHLRLGDDSATGGAAPF